jgi:hypothetical protein
MDTGNAKEDSITRIKRCNGAPHGTGKKFHPETRVPKLNPRPELNSHPETETATRH